MGYELRHFFFGNFSLTSKKNCLAQYRNKLINVSFFLILCQTGTFCCNCFIQNKKELFLYNSSFFV